MKFLKFQSISGRLSFGVSLSIIVIALIFNIVASYNARNLLEEEMNTKLHQTLALSAGALSLHLWTFDMAGAGQILSTVADDREIAAMHLTDSQGKTLFTITNDLDHGLAESFYEASTPILKDYAKVGEIQITLTDVYRQAELRQRQRQADLRLILQLLFSIFIIRILSRLFLGSLPEMEAAANNISEGNFDNYIERSGTNELASLRKAILRMQTKLKEQSLQIQDNLQELKVSNEELKNANIEIEALYGQSTAYNEQLTHAIDKTNQAYKDTVTALARAVEAKDTYTAGHCDRVSSMSRAIGLQLSLPPNEINTLELAATLHDIGKIGIPSSVLNKPGRLTKDEYDVIKTHSTIGYKIIKDVDHLKEAALYVLQHHERVDGNGYPHGLVGEQISLGARILGLVDSVDAMASIRSYRQVPLTGDQIRSELLKGKGTQFDAGLVDLFIELMDTTLAGGF